MDNLPAGVYSWELDAPEHFVECEESNSLECSCEEIELAKIEDNANAQADFERGN